jgi:hypothetical protein
LAAPEATRVQGSGLTPNLNRCYHKIDADVLHMLANPVHQARNRPLLAKLFVGFAQENLPESWISEAR